MLHIKAALVDYYHPSAQFHVSEWSLLKEVEELSPHGSVNHFIPETNEAKEMTETMKIIETIETMKTNDVLETIKARRSVRAYTSQQVAAEDLNLILEAATYAPSGMNDQTWHFTAIQDADKLMELNEKIKGAFAKSDDPHLQERGHSDSYCCYYHAPTLIIVSNEPTRWWAPMDCACAMQNIFLAARSLGLGSCWVNQLGTTCDDPEVRAYLTSLGILPNHRVYACAALGYAPANAPMKEKKRAEGTVTLIAADY